MKFSKLVDKIEKAFDSHEQGDRVKPKELSKLERLLAEKLARYREKLKETDDPHKRDKLQTRLKVVKAQLKKAGKLPKR
jgi:DNA-binding transcriptional MerR regulator